MDSILVSVVSLALIIVSSVTMTCYTMQSTNSLSDSWKQMEERSHNISRTDITVEPPDDYTGGVIDLTVINEGQISLSEFPRWDVIVQYTGGNVTYLTYTDSYPPGDDEWTVYGIYLYGGGAEVFDPGILDSGEQMVLSIVINPEPEIDETCRITVSTPNGVKAQTQVTKVE